MAKNNPTPENAGDPKDLYVDEKTEQKIAKHLTDETDEITEQDIADAPTGLAHKTADEQLNPRSPELPVTDVKPESAEKNISDNEDPDVDNAAWNVLES